MRILVAHSLYRSGALSGENRVVQDEVALLRSAGHDVDLLAPSPDELRPPALALRSVASLGLASRLRERVRGGGYDVVHFHNLYPAVGARALTAAAAGAAVVMTLHNYRLMCIAATFYRDGHVCEDCFRKTPVRGVIHGCYRGSRIQSAVLGASSVVARRTGPVGAVDRFLAVSEFVRSRHIDAGLPAERVIVKPNVVPSTLVREGPGRYFLVLSRMSVEKGLDELVRAWSPDLGTLRVVGDGPLRGQIERLAEGRGVQVEPPIEPDDVPATIADARAVLIPSACYEGQPRVALEAFSAGVPIVVSRLGALPELVDGGETGLTVARGDLDGWRAAARALADDEMSLRLGAAALRRWQSAFSPERGLRALESAYAAARESRSAQAGGRSSRA